MDNQLAQSSNLKLTGARPQPGHGLMQVDVSKRKSFLMRIGLIKSLQDKMFIIYLYAVELLYIFYK